MQTNLLWTGREYYSLENCLVQHSSNGARVNATIIGYYEEKIYKVEYQVITNENWETLFFQIDSRYNNYTQLLTYEGDGKGNWTYDGKKAISFKGCIDIDIPLTPFTNTLPIRRLRLAPNASGEIDVIYCDLLAGNIKRVRQRYTCLSSTKYQYENVPNDFEATIETDESGFVVDYPGLFERRALWEDK